MTALQQLRQKHPSFSYQKAWYVYENDQLTFYANFSLAPDIAFTPQVTIFGISPDQYQQLDPLALDTFAFLLGLVEIPSYWKATCSPEILLAPELAQNHLTTDLQNYVFDLLLHGLSEFYFTNQLTEFGNPSFVTINGQERSNQPVKQPAGQSTPAQPNNQKSADAASKILLPLGGGKDSLVALELLKKARTQLGSEMGILVLEPASPAAKLLAQQADVPIHLAKRTIDPKLKELNKQGYLNGHTPFSAYLSVLSSLVGFLFGYSHVALANERSANEGNITFHGLEVNHQWSKSFAYEALFHQAVAPVLPSGSPYYFSLLRPLYELQIAALFAEYYQDRPEILQTFKSCNRGQQQGIWCGECPKCLFAYVILSPFLSPEKVESIFGQNLFEKPSMVPVADDLLGKGSNKPLECVGMYQESVVAAWITLQSWYSTTTQDQLPLVLAHIAETIFPTETNLPTQATTLLRGWNPQHSLPDYFIKLLKKELSSLELPGLNTAITSHQIPFSSLQSLASQTILLLGLGREGKSSYQFLQQHGPGGAKAIRWILADSKPREELDPFWQDVLEQNPTSNFVQMGKDTMEWENISSILISPGISNHVLYEEYQAPKELPLLSNTELFFRLVAEHNQSTNQTGLAGITTIGVTGTKGKSTTSAVIHHVLSKSGLPTVLGGNIGTPPLEVLQQMIDQMVSASSIKQIFAVLELSCHQLGRTGHSPEIAVIMAITPEHLDYYLNFEEYLEAKSAICAFQQESDVVFFTADSPTATQLAKRSLGLHHGFSLTSSPVASKKMLIPGKHNVLNSTPAVLVAQHLGIEPEIALRNVYSFAGLPHRLQLVGELSGIRFYNDSLSTTPEAAMAAIESFDSPAVLIAGGYDRGLSYQALGEFLAKKWQQNLLRGVVLFPPSGEKIMAELRSACQKLQTAELPVKVVESMAEAVAETKKIAQPGDVVLLSPASASFGRFKDYADRGDQFSQLV